MIGTLVFMLNEQFAFEWTDLSLTLERLRSRKGCRHEAERTQYPIFTVSKSE